jgi:hypothetical protein
MGDGDQFPRPLAHGFAIQRGHTILCHYQMDIVARGDNASSFV